MKADYPDTIEIRPVTKPVNATIRVPGSKSITNRALVLGALADMDVPLTIRGALQSEDTELMVNCLRQLGYQIEPNWALGCIVFPFQERHGIPVKRADLFVGNSGTTLRFLTAMVVTGNGQYRLDGVPRMRERPIQDLLDTLNQLKEVQAISEFGNGCPPVLVTTAGLQGGIVTIRADTSSQFLSGMLLIAPFAEHDLTISVDGPYVSEPYIELTLAVLAEWDVDFDRPSPSRFVVRSHSFGQSPMTYVVEPDASSASYFFAAAAVCGGVIGVPALTRDAIQGDIRFVDVLKSLGCDVKWELDQITVLGGPLRGIDIDMNAISDTVMTLAAVACFADGPTTIRNVAHIRHKETDRITALATELRKLGVEVDEFPDGLKITPRPMHGAELETYNDHRMAMSLALIGLKVPGVVIKNPGCVAKTYPGFWQDFERLYG